MPIRDDIGDLPFGAEAYTVDRSLFRQKFRIADADGNRVLNAERNVAEGKVTFPFRNADDEIVFRISSKQAFDVAGGYVLHEKRADEPTLVLSKELSFRRHHWTIERPEGQELATVTSRRGLVGAVNTVSQMLSPFPQKFSVSGPNGERIGTIAGRFSPRTVYDVRIERPGATPRSALVAGAVAIAVLESV
ncbi:hypothetical protein [Haladaptatus sp. DFWS20]|uniref:hypothetical protein n=1 Tax=Haladaptatus sp. DFWS20 TaxID=3403467 RepID=UPI003EBB23BD